MSTSLLKTVDRRNPINWKHPLNKGRISWLLALPGRCGGSTFADLLGFEPGALVGSTWSTKANPGGFASVQFPGIAGDQINMPCASSNRTKSAFTFGCWVYATNDGTVFNVNAGGETFSVDLGHFGTAGNVNIFNGGAWNPLGPISQNAWHRLIVVSQPSGGLVYGYVDGVPLTTTITSALQFIFSSGSTLSFGCQLGPFGPLSGNMNDIFLSSALWGQKEAALDYQLSQTGYPGVLNQIPSPTFRAVGGVTAPTAFTSSSNINISGVASGSVLTAGSVSGDGAFKLVGVASASIYHGVSYSVSAKNPIHLSGLASGAGVGAGARTLNTSALSIVNIASGAGKGGGGVSFGSATNNINFAGSVAQGGSHSFFLVSATTNFAMHSGGSEHVSPIHVSATSRINLAGVASGKPSKILPVSATNNVNLAGSTSVGGARNYSVTAQNRINIFGDAEPGQVRTLNATASDRIALNTSGSVIGIRGVSAQSGLNLSSFATDTTSRAVSCTSGLIFGSSARANRDIVCGALTSIALSGPSSETVAGIENANATVTFHDLASATISNPGVLSTISFRDLATASVTLPDGGTVPGGDSNAGLRAVTYPNVSGTFPMSFAEAPDGSLLIANGVDPMLRWDGLSGRTTTAGNQSPATAIAMAGQTVGTITGLRYSFCRFVDGFGNPSAPSPISNAVNMGRDALIENIQIDPVTARCTILSTTHGLETGDIVVISGVNGLGINGMVTIAVVDADHFIVANVAVSGGTWQGGGAWTYGINEVVYQQVPVPLDPKIARRQILRNLDGSADVFFVDIDTTDLVSGVLTSTKDDETLAGGESVPLALSDDLPYMSRYAPPPSHKSIVASHMGRIFACGEVTITIGNVIPVFGSAVVQGVGTDWPTTLAGRFVYVTGASRAYEIASVNVASQTLTLLTPYADPSQAYATYAIRSAPGERRLVYYSEPGLWESWPPWNAFSLPEDNDEIVGMLVSSSYLYFIENRHIYRFTMQDEPSEGMAFLSIDRGAINNRCVVQVESMTYCLDEAGIHAFDGGQATEAISTPIQTIFQADGLLGGLLVDWSADTTLWHASHDPVRTTVRWFVQMEGYDGIFHAITYDYRQKRWWLEQYPRAITASTTGIVGYRRGLVGTDARTVLVLGEGSLDIVDNASPGYTGTVSSSDSTSLTDVLAAFPGNLSGAPVSISFGAGRGQQGIITTNTSTTLSVLQPWGTALDGTSQYVVGGVNWSWRSGWFQYQIDEEDENSRDINVTYQPTRNPATMDLQLYFDHSTLPKSWDFNVNQDGVEVIAGDPNITVNLQSRGCRAGWSLQRFGGHSEVYGYGEQYLQILLTGVQATESVRVYQINLNGVTQGDD